MNKGKVSNLNNAIIGAGYDEIDLPHRPEFVLCGLDHAREGEELDLHFEGFLGGVQNIK